MSHDAVHWWELAGHDETDLASSWALASHAVRIPGIVGKSWASPRGDAQHASMTWMSGQGLLDGIFVSEPIAGERPMRGVIRLWNLELFLVEESGSPIATTELVGKSIAEAHSWMVSAIENEAGPAPRPVQEPQKLPEHPVADGAPVGDLSQLAHAELIRLYSNTAAVLEQVAWTMSGATPVRMWPHSFEMSTQVRLGPKEESPPRFIVMGLAPPGKLSLSGYWYVAPWRSTVQGDNDSWEDLPFGSWSKPENEIPIAVLPVADVVSSEDPSVQHNRVASFFAAAFNQSKANLSLD
ncbi:MAG: hypothetical protein Phyf2KO_06540 [Phycisphaerales bacterium]